ncbi:MAG: hypothetical protein OWV35_08370 [Firmicutes bacterium]|nr:hypothetical protein [Bacillota bacterium]
MLLDRTAGTREFARCCDCGRPVTRHDILATGQARRCQPCYRAYAARRRQRAAVAPESDAP